jgi:hypothetical protein
MKTMLGFLVTVDFWNAGPGQNSQPQGEVQNRRRGPLGEVVVEELGLDELGALRGDGGVRVRRGGECDELLRLKVQALRVLT